MATHNDPWILGIGSSPHNGAACLLKGDEIYTAIQEERLTRRKRAALFGAYPSLALEYCLDYAGISPGDLSMVVCCPTNKVSIPQQDVSLNPILQTKLHNTPTLYIPHHYGHALSAFATSGFEESAILVIDGMGSPFEDFREDEKAACKWIVEDGWETISLYAASGTTIKPLEKQMVEHLAWVTLFENGMPKFGSLGGMYSAAATQIFGSVLEAGKIMGLAPYGSPEIPCNKFFSIEDGRFIFHDNVPKRFRHNDRWPLRQKEYSDLASSTQAALEEAVLYLVARLYELCPSENLCYAGGVALNSVTNERIIRESPFKNVYIIPAAEDCGAAIGAAYYGLWQLTGRNTGIKLIHDAVGRAYTCDEIRAAIEATPAIEVLDSEDAISDTVRLLCDGKIMGWFDGRSELGPRALGQRSILCDPRRSDAKDVLNSRVKHRESFRPFAPVVPIENAKEWFALDGIAPESPFMLRVCKFKNDKKAQVPGVTHVDDTGRLQTVTREANGNLYLLVKNFYEQTGVPIILNTSFNVAGEPIVETPQDALNTVLSTGIDYCYLGGKIVGKRREILFERNEIPWPQRIKRQIIESLNATVDAEQSEGLITPLEQERLPDSCMGTFEHDINGALKIEHKEHQLKATLFSRMALWQSAEISTILKRHNQDTYEAISGVFAGTKIIFLPDKRGRVNLLAVMAPNSNPEFFFRAPDLNAFDESDYAQIVGEYRSLDKLIRVSLRGKELIIRVPEQDGFELVPVKKYEFLLRKLPGYAVEFKAGASGAVTTAILTMPNEVVTLEKS